MRRNDIKPLFWFTLINNIGVALLCLSMTISSNTYNVVSDRYLLGELNKKETSNINILEANEKIRMVSNYILEEETEQSSEIKELEEVVEETETEPVVETVIETVPETQPIVETTEAVPVVASTPVIGLSEYEINLLAALALAEAEGESETGKRLVIDTVLNRLDSPDFPNSISEIIYQPNQYSPMWDGRFEQVQPNDYARALVIQEYNSRMNSEVLYFRTKGYFNFGTPLFQHGNHYFSK